MKNFFLSLTFITFLGVTLVSCSSDNVLNAIPDPNSEVSGILPAKASDISITSSGYVLASSKLTRAGSDAFAYYMFWDGNFPAKYSASKPSEISYEEKEFVKDYIKKNPSQAGVAFDYGNYFIQNIGSSYETYFGLLDQNHASHQVNGGNQMDYLVINGEHINNYNASYGPNALIMNLPFKNPTYHDSYGDVDQTKVNSYKIYKITYNGTVGFYLGFDYKTKKNDGQTYDGDGVYNDWVIKLIPADGITTEEPGDGGSTTPDTGSGTTPGTGGVTTFNNGQIEVNLSINAEKIDGDYIASHLSIHVRDTSDVEVFLPVAAQYYCEADDMAIVLSHSLGAVGYGSIASSKDMNFDVNGNTVKLTVTYEADGIRVTTSGINSNVLKYLRDTYGDGMTFEVWNYYKSNVVDANGTILEAFDRAKLKEKLNTANVKFTSDPGQYVNAFGAVYDYDGKVYGKVDSDGVWTPYADEALTTELGSQYWYRADRKYYILRTHKNELDCTVTPVNTTYTVKGTALFNQIYKK